MKYSNTGSEKKKDILGNAVCAYTPVIISELAFLSFLPSVPFFSPPSEFRDDENRSTEGNHFAFLSLAVGEKWES